MARPKKIGLPYFPLDCQMDDKVEMLEAEHGLTGYAVYIKLLQHIYQTENGELDMAIVFRWKTLGKQMDLPVETLQALVQTMFEVELFDRTAFEQRQVLTSNGVKKRISKVTGLREKDRSRKAEADSDPEEAFSAGKPLEKGGKGKGKGKGNKERNSLDAAPAADSEVELTSAPEVESTPEVKPLPGKRKSRAVRPVPPPPPALASRWPELVAQLDDEERETWARFVAWEKDHPLPRVFSMDQPLLPNEFLRLVQDFGKAEVADVLEGMENNPRLFQIGNSANRTARSWINLRRKKADSRQPAYA